MEEIAMSGASGYNEGSGKRIIRVSCALIEKNGKLLAARRAPDRDQPLKWELPGGKIEVGESIFDSIERELSEELGVDAKALEILEAVIHSYPEKTIELIPVRVEITSGAISALDSHHEIRWVGREEAILLDWADADRKLLERNSILDSMLKL